MSYLGTPRLHFSGRFQAAPSTVNNDPDHYNNATFKPEYQLPQTATADNGWWNPRGDAAFRLLGCSVTSALRTDGSAAAADDVVLACVVADTDKRVGAKLVDLDPEQQMVSQIWGLEVRICLADGTVLVRGDFEPVAFSDIWRRSPGGPGGDIGAGAAYHSVLTNVEWGDASSSPALSDLREAAVDGALSIKFNVDGYNLNSASARFTQGRIAGSIGPALADEPHHFVRGRQFMTAGAPVPGFFTPVGGINFCPAVVDHTLGKVHIDLGNALPTASPGGPQADLGALSLVCNADPPITVAPIDYLGAGWYGRTAGVVTVPADRALTSDELAQLAGNTLSLHRGDTTAISEAPGGLYVRADTFVFRLDPGTGSTVRLFASQVGEPLPGARIICFLDPTQLQVSQAPDDSTLEFPARVVTDEHGVALLEVRAKAPGNPRGFIDGMVFGVRCAIEDTLAPAVAYPFNPTEFVSFLVWDAFDVDDPPTWHGGIGAVFTQYANLYPVMNRLLDMSDYEAVSCHRDLLLLAYDQSPENPNAMPVTRDMSSAKRSAILRWLRELSDGAPRLGVASSVAAVSTTTEAPPAPTPDAELGGKSAAMARRFGRTRGWQR